MEVTTVDLSNLADACTEVATRLARGWAESRFGLPAAQTESRPDSSCWDWASLAEPS